MPLGACRPACAPEQRDDESVVYRRAIAVSPMQAGYAYPSGTPPLTREALAELLPAPAAASRD